MLVAMATPIAGACKEINQDGAGCPGSTCLNTLQITSNGPATMNFSVSPTFTNSFNTDTKTGKESSVTTEDHSKFSVDFKFEVTFKVGPPATVTTCSSALNHPSVIEFGNTIARDGATLKSDIAQIKAACDSARAASAASAASAENSDWNY